MRNQMSDDINAIFARWYEDSLTNPLVKIDLYTGAQFCLIMDKPSSPQKVINTKLEREIFTRRAARTSGDFDSLLEATKGGTILPFDHFVRKLEERNINK